MSWLSRLVRPVGGWVATVTAASLMVVPASSAAASTALAPAGSLAGSTAAPSPSTHGRASFVTREGSQLTLDGRRFRFAGPNIYWLGLDENVGGVDYPTYFRIRDALQTARGMGATVVRAHTLGVSTGDPRSLEPTLDEFNDQAFATIDYAIAQAGRLGLRLIVPLTDNWNYYHGGRADFTSWCGVPADAFYTDPCAIAAFKRYIDHLLTHVNPYTGKTYMADPTIMAWELGNELNGMPEAWIRDISAYLKERAPHQLVAAGQQSGINPATLTAPDVDIVDVHYYPPTADRISADAATVTKAGKVYIAGEFGSTSASSDLLAPVAADQNVSGALFWSLFAHNDSYGYVPHNDGFTLHYPGDNAGMRARAQALVDFAVVMNPDGLSRPPRPRLGRPFLTSITKRGGENVLAWRGTAIAAGYRVQRSTAGADGPWTTISDHLVSDNETPWMDLHSPRQAWYRVVPVDLAGKPGPASDPVFVGAWDEVLVDPLESWLGTQSHSDSLRIVPDGERALVKTSQADLDDAPQITWSHIRTTAFEVDVRAPTRHVGLVLATSYDGTTWHTVRPEVVRRARNEYTLRLSQLPGVSYVRVTWTSASVAVSRALLRSDPPAFTDPLDDWSKVADHSDGLEFDHANVNLFDGDTSRVKRTGPGPEYVVWHVDDLAAMTVRTYFWPDEPVSHFSFQTSGDGSTWVDATPSISGGTGNWRRFDYTLADLHGVSYVKVIWNNPTGQVWSPQLAAAIFYTADEPELAPPGPFTQSDPADGAVGVNPRPEFTWSAADDAAYYTLVVSPHADLSDPVLSVTGLRTTTFRPDTELALDVTYYWQVIATNAAGEIKATNAGTSFTTGRPVTPLTVEDFDEYASDADLRAAYQVNPGGDPVTLALDRTHTDGSAQALAFGYALAANGYAGASHTFAAPQDWSGYEGLRFWLQPSASAHSVTIQFVAHGYYWEHSFIPTGTDPRVVEIPFDEFVTPPWAEPGPLDLTSVTQLSIYAGGAGSGTDYLDGFTAYPAR